MFNLYAEYIIGNAGLDDYIKNLRHADDTNLMAENDPQAQMLLMEVSSIASTLSNNNCHSSLLLSFSEACYGRDIE